MITPMAVAAAAHLAALEADRRAIGDALAGMLRDTLEAIEKERVAAALRERWLR